MLLKGVAESNVVCVAASEAIVRIATSVLWMMMITPARVLVHSKGTRTMLPCTHDNFCKSWVKTW